MILYTYTPKLRIWIRRNYRGGTRIGYDNIAILERFDVNPSTLEVLFKLDNETSERLLSQMLDMACKKTIQIHPEHTSTTDGGGFDVRIQFTSSFFALSLLSGSRGKAKSFSSARDRKSK